MDDNDETPGSRQGGVETTQSAGAVIASNATSPTLADKPVLQKQFQKTKKLPGRQSRGAKLGGNDGLHVKKTRREWQSAQDSD